MATQIRREFSFTAGRIIVRGQLAVRGQRKRADYLLFYQPNLPIAVVEAKDNNHPVGGGMQQALAYAEALAVPFVFSSNGDAFVFHDRTGLSHPVERVLRLHEFPSPGELWSRYRAWKGLSDEAEKLARVPYYDDGSGKGPRYYQRIAIQRTIEAIARGERRVLLVMATGTGKTYTAFQIIWRLWKASTVKRVLFLADRNILVDQTITNDFKPFGSVMTKVHHRTVDKAYEVYLDKDLQGWRPPTGMQDDLGQKIEDRVYNQRDMDRVLVLNERTKRVAERLSGNRAFIREGLRSYAWQG